MTLGRRNMNEYTAVVRSVAANCFPASPLSLLPLSAFVFASHTSIGAHLVQLIIIIVKIVILYTTYYDDTDH